MGRTSPMTKANREAAMANMVDARKAAIDKMTPALKKKFKDLELKFGSQVESTLKFYRWFGKECSTIASDKTGKYGSDPLNMLADAMSTKRETMRKAMAFYNAYTEQEFKELISLRSDDDESFQIMTGHAFHLMTVPDKRVRKRLQKQVVDEKLTPAELLGLIKEHFGGPRSSGGRPLAKPATLKGRLDQMSNMSAQWLRRHHEVWRSEEDDMLAKLMETAPKTYDEQQLKQLLKVRTALAQMSDVAKQDVDDVNRVIEHVEATIKSKKSDDKPSRKKAKTNKKKSANKKAGKKKSTKKKKGGKKKSTKKKGGKKKSSKKKSTKSPRPRSKAARAQSAVSS